MVMNKKYIPKISVVMSVYNGEKYLHEAIDSILNQTFKDFEFIIIDDGSTDNSCKIIQSYKDERIILIQQENTGVAAAANRGLKIAKGKYIARMDADDISTPDRLEKECNFLESHPECVAIGSNAMVTDIKGEYLYTSSMPITWSEIQETLPKMPFINSTTMFRKELAIECGGYHEELKQYGEDRILFNMMARFGELRNIKEMLIKYRLVPSAATNISTKTNLIKAEIIKNVLTTGKILQPDLNRLLAIHSGKSKKWKLGNYYLRIGKIFIEKKFQRKKAIENFVLSIRYHPLNINTWFNLMLLLLPKSLIKKWKQSRGVV